MNALLLSVALIVANGIFVAYEFALIAANRSAFEAKDQSRVGRAAVKGFSDLSMQLAGAQVGITVCSLVLGYVGEPALAHLVEDLLGHSVSEDVSRVIGFVIALSIVAFFHLLIGEMVPKNIAIAKPNLTVSWLVLPYSAYLALVRPFVLLLNWLSVIGCRVLGVEPRDELVADHTTAELANIVASAHEEGFIEGDDAELLGGALVFSQSPVIDIGRRLEDIATLRFGSTPAQAERVARVSGQTRIPVAAPARGRQRLVGYLHAKDLLAIDQADRHRPIPESRLRKMVLVQAEQPVVEVLRLLRGLRAQLAVVIEAGEPVAVVSVEHIIRTLVEQHQDM